MFTMRAFSGTRRVSAEVDRNSALDRWRGTLANRPPRFHSVEKQSGAPQQEPVPYPRSSGEEAAT